MKENRLLKEENKELKAKLQVSIVDPLVTTTIPIGLHKQSSSQEKIDLFRSLFSGRIDVYAKRWYSEKLLRGGYSPVCENEWQEGLCNKKKYKCNKCPNRKLAKLTDKAIYNHLAGKDKLSWDVIGIYPMLRDETTNFLAIDFDKGSWKDDVGAFRKACNKYNLQPSVERSRSGDGAHIWFFFEKPIPAVTARRFGSGLLTLAMNEYHQLKFDSYDRLFPNQDIMPTGGFGNLIALPLQGAARKSENSVFIDENFNCYSDQWAYLQSIKRISIEAVEELIKALCKEGDLGLLLSDKAEQKPWEKAVATMALSPLDFPSKTVIVMANMLYIEKSGVSDRALNQIKRLAAFKNPEFYKAQAMRLPTYDKPRIISSVVEDTEYLGIPRGCKDTLIVLLESIGISYEIADERAVGKLIKTMFNGELRDNQILAEEALLLEETGVLSAATAFGKTVIIASIIAKRKVNTLILVHTQALMSQWKKALEKFLVFEEELPKQPVKRGRKKRLSIIGQLGGSKNTLSGIIDVATIQSLGSGNEILPLVREYGMVIVDECHHLSAVSFEAVLKEVSAKYVYGLTATPVRQDGQQPIIFMQCGAVRYHVDAKEQAGERNFEHVVYPRFTFFRKPLSTEDWAITDIYAAVCENSVRNQLIISDITAAMTSGRSPIVLTERFAHAKLLTAELEKSLPNVFLLTGKATAKEKREIIENIQELPPTEPMVIVATGKYVGEGFDVPRLDTLFLAMPIAWKGSVAQYAGRLHRDYEGKESVIIYDYVDIHVPVLERMYHKRMRAYTQIGYKPCADSDIESIKEPNTFFDNDNFLSAFSNDIISAKKEIIISSIFLVKSRIMQIVRLLEKGLIMGVKVVVVTQSVENIKETSQIVVFNCLEILEEYGVKIIRVKEGCQNFAVMDSKTVWYGSLSFLGYGRSDDNLMRLENQEVAEELLGEIQNTQQRL